MKPASLLFLLLVATARGEIARWADPGIPLQDGLELWLDARRENEAREAHYMNRLAEGQGLDLWHDSSGRSRHLAQWTATARPAWRDGTVSFDGDDFLAALLAPGLESKECTVFLVAAPDRATGDFPALFSAARRDQDDYTSGLTIDFGREAGREGFAEILNVEGAGQSGERNLLGQPIATGHGHLFTISSGPGGTILRADGSDRSRRERGDIAFSMDRVAVGARFVEPAMRHFFRGRIAEIVFYNRRLDAGELSKVEAWLATKHAGFLRPPDPAAVKPLPAKGAPLVQMLVPGFRIDELPVETTNLNNLEYAADGRLFAAGYDGRFHLLRDTDQDGLEDRLDTFSPATSDNYPIGLVVKDGMPHAVLSDEIIRFRDGDGDGVPETRETVAKGWDDPLLRDHPGLMHRRVDSALALAAGPDGSWYVTMGSANPGNGYWQKAAGDTWSPDTVKAGTPAYTPDKRRGCLLRIAPDGKVEQLNSGLRYIMSLQWDRHGELFGTDQEGATWLPNGNPFDELLHLQTGRHYGFPPRHPKWLPGVVDEPSVWDYAPQHQSACGFRFNGPARDRPRFGPDFWAHDALVTGESRGKLWRTTLAKTAAGYVANNHLIAAVGMLVTDCALSPRGDLVICCHSGPPDWGSGPAQQGKLFKIRYLGSAAPQPVLTWAQDATTTVIAFDRPLDPAEWQDLASRIHLESGRFVAAADRFEVIRPGYEVVRAQQSAPRVRIPVTAATLSDDRRGILIETAPRVRATGYAITLDAPRDEPGIPQAAAIDLAHELTGLQASWQGQDGATWTGWLPHPDPAVAREFTRGSAGHELALAHLAEPGKWVFRARLDLANLLQPATQPGAKLDYPSVPETVTLSLASDAAASFKLAGSAAATTVTKTLTGADWLDLEIEFTTPATRLEFTYHTALDPRPRPLGIRRFLMPFAVTPEAILAKAAIPEIAGGDWARGKALFHGKATCFTCHQMHGEGHAVGPDLGNTLHRDHASVLRDINDPSATLNPDAVGYQITLHDGGSVTGIRVGETADELKLAAPGGQVTAVKKADIRGNAALPVSLMPPGLLSALGEREVKDLMTFLLTAPPEKE
jgi:putative heme-binding domain-containing protein